MISPPTSFSSKLRLSKKLDYGFGVLLFLITTTSFVWVMGRYILVSGVDAEEIPSLTILLICAVINFFFLLWCLLYILQSHLTIDQNGIVYQEPFFKTVLSWEDVEGFAFPEKSLCLVYNSSSIRKRSKWVNLLLGTQPMIHLSWFTSEWPPRNESLGPLMSTIFHYAPHLFIDEVAGAGVFPGA